MGLDDDMLDKARQTVNKAEIISNMRRWDDQLQLLLEAGWSQTQACKVICYMMLQYIDRNNKKENQGGKNV